MQNDNSAVNANNTSNANIPLTPPVVVAPVVPSPQSSPPVATQEKDPPQDPETGYEKLDEQYRKAIDLKLLHYPNRVIAKKLIAANFKANEGTVSHWFSVGGTCYDAYQKLVAIRRKELDIQIENQKNLIEQGTANALIIVNKVLNKAVENDEISEQDAIAARDMLDRGGVPKLSKVDNNNKVDAEGVATMAALIKSILDPAGISPAEKTK